MSSLLLMCGGCQVRWLWPQNPQGCRTFLIPLLFLCYQRTKKVEEAFTWWCVEVLRSGEGLMSFILLLTRAQKLESGLNAVKPHTWSQQELNFLLFLTMPRCKKGKKFIWYPSSRNWRSKWLSWKWATLLLCLQENQSVIALPSSQTKLAKS